ncbi:hypothetical protein [Nocardioides zeae]
MTAVASRGSRGVVLFALLLVTTVGLLLLTATWTPRWGSTCWQAPGWW